MLQKRIFTIATITTLSLSDAYLSYKYTLLSRPLLSSDGKVTSFLRIPTSSLGCRNNEWHGFLSRNHFRSRSNLALASELVLDKSSRGLKRRSPPSKKSSIKWCVQSAEKILKEEWKDLPPKNDAKDNLRLVEALWLLFKARTQKDVVEAGRIIEDLDIVRREKFSFAVQERVMKAVAMTGLLDLSMSLLYSMIGTNDAEPETAMDVSTDSSYIPSYMAYTAVLNTLRKRRKVYQLKKTMKDLVNACQRNSTNLHVVAFNTYLAALCDNATSSPPKSPKNFPTVLSEPLAMIQPGVATKEYAVMGGPDTFSFNTVLNAAASINNDSIMDEVIGLMESQGVASDIYTYNARLKALQTTKMDVVKNSQRILIIDEILASTNLRPDAYTIELSLRTLAWEGRIGDILSLLDNFNPTDKREGSISNAYTTFLLTLVKSGEVECARFILDTYILPQSKTLNETYSTKQGLVGTQRESIVRPRPSTRHFNCVIEGYSIVNQGKKSFLLNGSPLEHATSLYRTMISMNVLPDAYTFTMMVGLQNSSVGITKLWKQSMVDLKTGMSIPMFNSMMTGYGRVNDPSSACFVFDYMMKKNLLNKSHNSWNVLLSSFAKSSLNTSIDKIQCMASDASSFHQLLDNDLQAGLLPGNRTISNIVDGLNSIEAAKLIFDLMKSGSAGDAEFCFIPSPNAPSYCLIASVLSHGVCEIEYAMIIYKDAVERGIYPDGRFLNAILRCCGDDVDRAVKIWKTELRKAAKTCDEQRRSPSQNMYQSKENLIVTYHGLFHVAGRAGRADIALRLSYAMNKDGIEPTETAMNCYKSGLKRQMTEDSSAGNNIPIMMKHYENLLAIECTKYEVSDKRRVTDQRLRIIF